MCLMSGKVMRFQVPPKTFRLEAGSRKESGCEFHTVRPATEERPGAIRTATKPRNIQFATAGRTEMLATGNFGDWHAAVSEIT